MNHSSRYSVVGANSKPHPTAFITPWVAISTDTLEEKVDAMRLIVEIARPAGPKNLRSLGQRERTAKVNGEQQYRMPVAVVPMTGMLLRSPCSSSG